MGDKFLVCIIVSKYGKVNDYELNMIIELMRECYIRLEPHKVSIVDLYIFENSLSAEAFLAMEQRRLGVKTLSFNEHFFAMHDAWRGTPRIILCLDRMRDLPKLVRVGGIRHEVGHTVLHGSIEYYLFPFPRPLLELVERFSLPERYAVDMLYLVSIAVKDYEVTRLLYQRGYIEDQVAYVKSLLKVSEGDVISWGLSRGDPLLEALYLMGLLKTIGCAAPLLADRDFGDEIEACLRDSVSYLPKDLSTVILNIAKERFTELKDDTLSNISNIICACKPILDTILNKRA